MSKTIFDNEEFKPYQKQWNARMSRLALMKSYYTGNVYKGLKDVPVIGPRLYKGVKPLYLPLSRAVDVDAGIIPGDWALDPELVGFDALEEAKRTLFDMSDWDVDGVLFVHYGAQYGVTGLKVADIREERRVVIKPLDPQIYMLAYDHLYSKTASMALIVEKQQGEDGVFE